MFLAALFGLGMNEEQREIYRRHTGRSDVPSRQFRECFLICGRRSGKSIVASLIGVFLACFYDFSAYLAPGETGVVMILGADRRQCRTIFNYCVALLEVPLLRNLVAAKLKESIHLTNGLVIEVHTSNYKSVRGATVVAAICDELAFWQSEDTANPDVEVLNALRPSMATIPNALLLGISSPFARKGVLYNAHKEHFGKDSPDTLVWQADSKSMNPLLPEAVIAAAYAKDPSSARAEYGGLFREDIEAFLSLETVEARMVPGRRELPYDPEKTYYGFVDPSGGVADSFTMAIGHFERDLAVLDVLREVPAPLSPKAVTNEFAAIFKAFRVHEIEGDHYAGEWPREEFEKCGVSYRVAEKTKNEMYLEMLPILLSSGCELLDNPRISAQLTGLERRTGRGRDSVDHAPGSHDDVANCVAGLLCRIASWNVTGGFAVLDWARKVAKEIAEGVRDLYGELIHKPAPPKPQPAVENPITRVDGFKAWLEGGKAPLCPLCHATCTIYVGNQVLHCNACGSNDGIPRPKPIENNQCPVEGCGLPLVMSSGSLRCQNHGQVPDSTPVVIGMSRAQLRGHGGFMLRTNVTNRFGRFG